MTTAHASMPIDGEKPNLPFKLSTHAFLTGTIMAAPLLSPEIVMHGLRITKDGITYNGQEIKDAGAVHVALMDVLTGRAALAQQGASRGALDEIFAAIDEAQRMNRYNESSVQIGVRVARLKCLADDFRAAQSRAQQSPAEEAP